MAITKPNSLNKQKAIYSAFKPYLSHEQLMQALLHWELNYTKEPTFSVRYYIADIVKNINPNIPVKALHVNLVSALANPSQAQEDPSTLLQAYKVLQHQEHNKDYRIPEIEAFHVLLKKWLGGLRPDIIIAIHVYLSSEISKLDIDKELKVQTTKWLNNPNYKMRVQSIQVHQLQKITTLVYVACCSYIGPTEADDLLSTTLKSLSNNGGAIYASVFKQLL